MTLQVGDYVKWDITNAGDYPRKYGAESVMVVYQADSDFVYLKYKDTESSVGSEPCGFYHHRFVKVNRFLLMAKEAIESTPKKKEIHGQKKQAHTY